MRDALIHLLYRIPPSNQPALPLAELAGDLAPETATGAVMMLEVWGMVTLHEGHVRAASQTALYALHSVAEWLRLQQPIITDWHTRGMDRPPLATGAAFLHLLEQHRLDRDASAPPTRREAVAQVIIKRTNRDTSQPEFLFQYDHNASRYQLIGGRYSPTRDAHIEHTAEREVLEELALNTLLPGENFTLRPVAGPLTMPPTLSPTFGALTAYTFTFFLMQGLREPLRLGEHDRWIDLPTVRTDPALNPPHQPLFSLLEQHVGTLDGLPDSFGHAG